jgi:hypothetical protein
MDKRAVKPVSYFVRLLQALFISAVLLAPAIGQIHKTVHALDDCPTSDSSGIEFWFHLASSSYSVYCYYYDIQ